MKQLLTFLTMAGISIAANAAELKSFLGVNFGESVYQAKFVAFDDALKSKGMSPSDINLAVYAAFKGTYIYTLPKPFKSYDEVLVKANANGEVYYVGVLEFFKGEYRVKKIKECAENAKWVIASYGNDAIQITDKTHSELFNKLKENMMSGVSGSADAAQAFFGFTNTNGGFSQIVTTSVICDRKSGDGILAMGAEDVSLENIPARKSQINGQSEERTPNAPQLSRAQALLAKDRAKKQAAEESRQKGLDSFCGIEFGTVFNGEMSRTKNGLYRWYKDGQYLTCLVRLNAPFRGKEVARIYASISSRRIFCIEIDGFEFETTRGFICDIVSKRYGFEPIDHTNPFQRITDEHTWKFKSQQIKFYFDYTNNKGDELYDVFNKSGILSATDLRWKKVADEEFEKESGGDGSAVL